MPTMVTPVSNPSLWSELNAIRVQDSNFTGTPATWIYYEGKTYKPVMLADGSWVFNVYTNEELYDSGSLTDPAGGEYGEIDG